MEILLAYTQGEHGSKNDIGVQTLSKETQETILCLNFIKVFH